MAVKNNLDMIVNKIKQKLHQHFVLQNVMELILLNRKLIQIIVEFLEAHRDVKIVKLLMDGYAQIRTTIKLKIHVSLIAVMVLRFQLKIQIIVLFLLIQQKIQMVANNVKYNPDTNVL